MPLGKNGEVVNVTINASAFNVSTGNWLVFRMQNTMEGQGKRLGIHPCETSVKAPFASLGDLVWKDLDCDGTQDIGESGIANVTVNLYYGNGTYIRNTTTNATGYYIFTGLKKGNYKLRFALPNGYIFTLQNASTDGEDSDANVTGWTTDPISLRPGKKDMNWDAGLCSCYASIGDFVWNDCIGTSPYDGIQQVNETGVPTVNVSLYSSTNVLVNTTQTNVSGFYSFTNLTPGDYYLVFELPGGMKWTLQDQSGNDSIDSDVNASTNRTINITLGYCEKNMTWDAGLLAVDAPCLPIPEMDTAVLFSAGVLTLAGYVVVRRRRRRD